MGTESAKEVRGEYGRIRSEYQADAWLYGTVTTKEFTQGESGWGNGIFRKAGRSDAHVIEVLTEATKPSCRVYLRKCGVSYILAGADQLDSELAAEK